MVQLFAVCGLPVFINPKSEIFGHKITKTLSPHEGCMVSKKSIISPRLACALLIMALAGGGCLPKTQNASYLNDGIYVQDQEEEVGEPYIPRDDGIPLSAEELKAFTSKGQLDASLSHEHSQIVELHFKSFVHRNRLTFERYLARSARYLPYAKKVFQEKGLPEEMAYLFIIESGGNPNAYSRAKATGLWQFMSFTGKKYGLTQSNWYDERRDPFKSTHAAADYLLKLYNDFGDWHLAAAAYNAGEGKIGRALAGTGAKTFFELCERNEQLDQKTRLRKETLQYVPSLIAVSKIMRNLDTLGFTAPAPEEAYDLTPVDVPPGTSLTQLARSTNLTWDEFSAMNPAFRRTASPPTMRTVAYLPHNIVENAQAWLASAESRKYSSWQEYKVKRGDTLNTLAKRNKTTVAAIQQANDIKKLPLPGKTILIPNGHDAEPILAALPEKNKAPQGRAGKYTIKGGDSLFSLASEWGTSVESIQELNKLSSSRLQVGQVLSIPSDSNKYKNVPKAGTHIVRRGESLSTIASAYDVSVSDILKANRLNSKTKLQIGQKLYITAENTSKKNIVESTLPKSSPSKPGKVAGKTHKVQQGDSLSKIAAEYGSTVGDIMRANNLTKDSKLRIGQALVVPRGTASTTTVASTNAKAAPRVISIQKGDTLYNIARKHNTSVAQILTANKLTAGATLKLGQQLIIP